MDGSGGFERWAAEQLAEVVAQREADRLYVERKATLAATVAIAVAGFAASKLPLAPGPMVLAVVATVALIGACLWAAQANWVSNVAVVYPSIFSLALEQSENEREAYRKVIGQYESVADRISAKVAEKSSSAKLAQACALASVLLYIGAVGWSEAIQGEPSTGSAEHAEAE